MTTRIVLAFAAAALVCGCYQPEVRDCTVSCQSAGDCADGQACTSDGWCASPQLAGGCAAVSSLELRIERPGRVVIDGLELSCESSGDTEQCGFDLAPGTSVTLRVVETDGDFDKWTTGNCERDAETCTVVVDADGTTVGAKFRNPD